MMGVFSFQFSVFSRGSGSDRPNPLTPFPKGKGGPEISPVLLPLPFRGGGWGVGSALLELCLLLAFLTLPSVAFAQPANMIDEAKAARRKAILEGTEAFRRLLFDEQLTALDDWSDLEEKPETKILIVLGDLDVLPKGLIEFARKGGAVLIASDRRPSRVGVGDSLREMAGVSIRPHTLNCYAPIKCYRGLQHCPLVYQTVGALPALFNDPKTGQPLSVATNVPSFLTVERRGSPVRPIATLPLECTFETPKGLSRLWGVPLFAVAGDVGEGRVLVLADHSIFINEMMLPQDNGNVDFASNAIAWLRGDDANRRTQVLFVEEGKIQTNFEIPLKSINIPPEEIARLLFEKRNEILVTANNVLVRLEDQGSFDNGVMNLFDRAGFPPARLGRYAFVALTIALGLYALYRVGIRSGFRHDLSAPMLPIVLDRNLPVAALAEQRHLTMLARGNLSEPATHLARQWFARLGVEAFDGQMPTLDARGGWWRRRRLAARLGEAWRVASGHAGRVTPQRLRVIERDLSELRAAHERGEWRLFAAIIGV